MIKIQKNKNNSNIFTQPINIVCYNLKKEKEIIPNAYKLETLLIYLGTNTNIYQLH